ncbi:hypothetical protein GQ53DRAFT_807867 [Thozetella sp. PMI_491]|nr:hypothetical protein GQ53DRAFT_807867 [Thozetella sp. PMI_491]
MPIARACCLICGSAIIDHSGQPPWMARFHALYAAEVEASTRACISGPGFREEFGDFIDPFPSPYDLGEDDGGDGDGEDEDDDEDNDEEILAIDLMRSMFGNPRHLPFAPDREPRAWGFPFHSACWRMLLLSSPVSPLDTQALMNLCRSFPIQMGLINWGHDYGGLVYWDNVLTPGEEPIWQHRKRSLTQDSDPLVIPELHQVFRQRSESASLGPLGAHCLTAQALMTDIFARLPAEILELILIHLASRDVVRLKQASRIYASVPLRASFWKSRFLLGQEFHHVFEARQSNTIHWRSLYSSAKSLESLPAMVNRKRVWNLCLSLHGLLETTTSASCEGEPIRSFFEPQAPPDGKRWVTASRALKRPINTMSAGSRILYERRIVLAPNTTAILASTVAISGRRYLSGITVREGTDRFVSLGYRHPETEVVLLEENGPLRIAGFLLAHGQQGIRGLAAISHTGVMSNWIGDHHDIPKRKLFTMHNTLDVINCLRGGFDSLKLVSLAVNSSQKTQIAPGSAISARDTALWYPDIPPLSLSFLGVSEHLHQSDPYQELPLCFKLFGDLDGECGQTLTGITVETRAPDQVTSIIISTAQRGATRLGLEGNQSENTHEFPIDGAGGELIASFETYHSYGQLLGFTLRTNRSRSADFPPNFLYNFPRGNALIRSTNVEREVVIGFWGMISNQTGFSDIGLIVVASEAE